MNQFNNIAKTLSEENYYSTGMYSDMHQNIEDLPRDLSQKVLRVVYVSVFQCHRTDKPNNSHYPAFIAAFIE